MDIQDIGPYTDPSGKPTIKIHRGDHHRRSEAERVSTRSAGSTVAGVSLGPARVDDLVEHVDEAVVGLDVALVAGARRRGHGGAESVVNEVLAEHAAVGDRRALGRGERSARERVAVDDALDDVVLADFLRERAVHRGELGDGLVARREDGDVRRREVDAVRSAYSIRDAVAIKVMDVKVKVDPGWRTVAWPGYGSLARLLSFTQTSLIQ